MPTLPGIVAQLQARHDELADELAVVDQMLAAARKQGKGLLAVKEDETFTCPECGRKFAGGGALGSHRSLKHGVKGESWKAKKAREGKEKEQEPEPEEDQLRIT